jgi:hypothetical protein
LILATIRVSANANMGNVVSAICGVSNLELEQKCDVRLSYRFIVSVHTFVRLQYE